ncbi:MAG TPA: Holliday junction branch migration protein RuvA [Sphaerochaeta sp.]|jgi:Holliday junction DNA helicase RuvA|nr:MAG: Holliday junction DNA helicase RuvA [Spirochaetes bacterium GWC2_52_13]PKL20534.1 MAG: Holliday junction branch migration protein RuvA [Spirochaetae bacterium HGW-Spirochaetae-4]HCG64195.1 Holliday junction branch migration protein RuvA [Sphaerochaeta sp.]HCJ93759.1 Holliday junction branch migration protein RuvA [Sphaerochaeta sp.]HCS35139.1 Holliday junction branch migration protein RuvA [Sphaerochaeta sp.]
MIHAVIGEVIHVGAQEVVLRTAGGIEYELFVSSQTASKLSQLHADARRQVRLLSWLQHREDSMTLYGFTDDEERMLFLELIKVNGIGPRQAMKILSGVQVRAFIRALDESDMTFLSTIPGVGPKTSQKIVLALRDTVVLDIPKRSSSDNSVGNLDKRYEDLVVALADMGYDKRQVVSTLTKLLEENHELIAGKSLHESEEFLFRNAIVRLG